MSPESHHEKFSISWTSLCVALGIITLSALATLVVIVSIKEVDVLSAVALTLAILAFAAQLIVLLYQTQNSTQQTVNSERITAETRGLLSEISTQSSAMLAIQTKQFDRVLEAALGPDAVKRAVEVAAGNEEEGEPINRMLSAINTDALSAALRDSARGTLARSEGVRVGNLESEPNRYQDFIDEMKSWPSEEESKEAIHILRKMSPLEVSLLLRMAGTDIRRARMGREPKSLVISSGAFGSLIQSLVTNGLITHTPVTPQLTEKPVLERRVTKLGRVIARLLNASNRDVAFPEWILDAFKK